MTKKFFAALLVLVMLFTGTQTAFAVQKPSEKVVGEVFEIADSGAGRSRNIAVLTFDSKYVKKGEALKVYLDFGEGAGTTEVDAYLYMSEIYTLDGISYPQVFIEFFDYYMAIREGKTSFRVAPGAFETADGEKSGEAILTYSDCNEDVHFELPCIGEKVVSIKNKGTADQYVTVLNKSKITATADIKSAYAEAWRANAKTALYDFKRNLLSEESSFTAGESSAYVVEYELNDFMRTGKHIRTIEKSTAYFDRLADAAHAMLMSPIDFIAGLRDTIVPPFGSKGLERVRDALTSIPNFFIALFGKIATEEAF